MRTINDNDEKGCSGGHDNDDDDDDDDDDDGEDSGESTHSLKLNKVKPKSFISFIHYRKKSKIVFFVSVISQQKLFQSLSWMTQLDCCRNVSHSLT